MEETCYEVELEKLRIYSHLAQSVNDVRQGRIEKIDTAFDDVLFELDGIEL